MMLADIIGYLPHLLAGLVLTLVAWLVATVLRAAVSKGLADDRAGRQAQCRGRHGADEPHASATSCSGW